MTNRRPIPIASPSWRRTRAHSAWNVPASTSRPPSPTRLMIRSRSSAGGPVRERDREDPPRRDVLDADEVGDPVGEHAGLARAGAGQDEQRPVGRRDGPRLLRVEGADDLARRGAARAAAARRRPGRAADRRLVLDRRRPRRAARRAPAGGRGASASSAKAVPEAGRLGGLVERAVAGSATSGGTHPPIVGWAHPPGPLPDVPGGLRRGLDLVGRWRRRVHRLVPLGERQVERQRALVAERGRRPEPGQVVAVLLDADREGQARRPEVDRQLGGRRLAAAEGRRARRASARS